MNSNSHRLIVIVALILTGTFNSPAAVPRPEHPRPDMQRENWMTLNGEWQFEIDKAADGEARGLTYGKDLNAKITVPFAPRANFPASVWVTLKNSRMSGIATRSRCRQP